MINCRQSTEWVIKDKQEALSIFQKLQLWMHLAMCKFCRRFAQQDKIINKAANAISGEDFQKAKLTAGEKQTMISRIRQQISN